MKISFGLAATRDSHNIWSNFWGAGQAKAMIDPYATLYPMLVDACFRGDFRLALQALRLDPVCSHLTWDQVRDLGTRLVAAHGGLTTAFASADAAPRLAVGLG